MGKRRRKANNNNNRKRKRNHHSNNKKNPQHPPSNKNKKKKFWIQDCPELVVLRDEDDEPPPPPPDVLLWLTVADLFDHHHRNTSNNQQNNCNDGENGSSSSPDTPPRRQGGPPPPMSATWQRTATATTATTTRETTTAIASQKEKEEEDEHYDGRSDGHEQQDTNDDDDDAATISIQRAPAAAPSSQKKNNRIDYHKKPHYTPLPNGDCGDGIVNPYENDVVPDKYWAQRHRLFTKFDDGIQMDNAESWYSVTPEAIARHIAKRMVDTADARTNHQNVPAAAAAAAAASSCQDSNHNSSQQQPRRLIVLDAFVGVGGNAIALAQEPDISLVVCVDNSWERLQLAAHNAHVYNIPHDKLIFVHANALSVMGMYDGGFRRKESKEGVSTSRNKSDDGAAGDSSSAPEPQAKEEHLCGYPLIRNLEQRKHRLLPPRLDAIFLSPPWGGVDYEEIGPRHYNLGCIQLRPDKDDDDDDDDDNKAVARADNKEQTYVIDDKNHDDDRMVDGVQLLEKALCACATEDYVNVAMFLPRNLNGLVLGQDLFRVGIRGGVEMEENRLNGKLKTITVYLQGGTHAPSSHTEEQEEPAIAKSQNDCSENGYQSRG